MIIIEKNSTENILQAEEGKVLTNGGNFVEYPTSVIVSKDNNDWYEIDKPIENE